MDLFELLFIALFIIFPILEGVLRQRKKGKSGGPEEGEVDTEWPEPAEAGEDRAAAEMLPDDLWELMTGEQRTGPEAAGEPDEAWESEEAPWSVDPESSPARAEADPEDEEDWRSEPWVVDDEATAPEPVSLEYEGPEAYSLETPAPEPVERRVPTAEARHRAFHQLVDRPKRGRRRRLSPLMKALRSPDGLRQAVLFKEILGPPKGLQ